MQDELSHYWLGIVLLFIRLWLIFMHIKPYSFFIMLKTFLFVIYIIFLYSLFIFICCIFSSFLYKTIIVICYHILIYALNILLFVCRMKMFWERHQVNRYTRARNGLTRLPLPEYWKKRIRRSGMIYGLIFLNWTQNERKVAKKPQVVESN